MSKTDREINADWKPFTEAQIASLRELLGAGLRVSVERKGRMNDPTKQPLGGHAANLFTAVRRFIRAVNRAETKRAGLNSEGLEQACLYMERALEAAGCGYTWTEKDGQARVCVSHTGHKDAHDDINYVSPSQEQLDNGVERDPSHFDVWTKT